MNQPFWKEKSSVQIIEKQTDSYFLVLYNDDYNTFDHVIESLVQVCNHSELQAEQCAWFVHYKGKCEVQNGEKNELIKKCTELLRRGLSAKVI